MKAQLNKRAIDQATYQGPGGCYLWDAELRGFGLRIYPAGRKSFVLTYRSRGRQRFFTLGRYGELKRFYVAATYRDQGFAARLMAAAEVAAAAMGGKTFWLAVWEENPRAIAFYRKCGFEDVGSQTFQMGPDTQFDRVLALWLPPSPAAELGLVEVDGHFAEPGHPAAHRQG